MNKYAAYYAADDVYRTFESFQMAKDWLIECDEVEIADETIDGQNFIAQITHWSKFVSTDKRTNYHEHSNQCPNPCEKETWPYGGDADVIGKIEYV